MQLSNLRKMFCQLVLGPHMPKLLLHPPPRIVLGNKASAHCTITSIFLTVRIFTQYVMHPQLQSTCHYSNPYVKNIWHMRLGGANNMHPLSWGGGYKQKKSNCSFCLFQWRSILPQSLKVSVGPTPYSIQNSLVISASVFLSPMLLILRTHFELAKSFLQFISDNTRKSMVKITNVPNENWLIKH